MGDGLMADTVTVPGMGEVKKKWIVAGVAVVAAAVAWSFWRSRSAGVEVIEETVEGLVETGDSGVGNLPGRTGDPTGNFGEETVIDTVAKWTEMVKGKLTSDGFDAQYVTLTIGRWIAGETLNDQEKQLIQAAVAVGGQPPGGPYPIKTALPATPPATPPPPVVPQRPAPEYHEIPVARFTKLRPPWNSTISGIAAKYGRSTSSVWNDEGNAALRAQRGKPELIREGDIVRVRK